MTLAFPATPLDGQTRHFRRYDAGDGLVPAMVISLAQDLQGLIWVGTAGGVYRFDGYEFRKWAPGRLNSWIRTIAVAPDGRIVALEESRNGLYEIVPDGATHVSGPDGLALTGLVWATFDEAGTLWVAWPDAVQRMDAAGNWSAVPVPLDGSSIVRVISVRGPLESEVFLLTSRGVYSTDGAGPPTLRVPIDGPIDVGRAANGELTILTFAGEVVKARGDGTTVTLYDAPSRGINLHPRGGTLWASFDRSLVALVPGLDPDVLDEQDGLTGGGGALLIDHEGSLWVGSQDGLLHFPEPDTRIWTETHGLPNRQVRFLARGGDTIFVATWERTGAIVETPSGWTAVDPDRWQAIAAPFRDSHGSFWIGTDSGLLEVRSGLQRVAFPEPLGLFGFAEDARTGDIWLASTIGLFRVRPGATAVRIPVGSLGAAPRLYALLLGRDGILRAASADQICRADGGSPGHAISADRVSPRAWSWECRKVPVAHQVSSLVEMPSGAIWFSVNRGGIYRLGGDGPEVIPGALGLESFDVRRLVAARSGGVWIVGPGGLLRVEEAATDGAGWRVLERISTWNGLHTSVEDVVEDDDGVLWVATPVGVARIPESARRPSADPPRVNLVDAVADDERLRLDVGATLPAARDRLLLRFAAASYRDASRLRYQIRLLPGGDWESIGGVPEFRWVGLPPGRFRADVRASTDGGETWSAEPASFDFRVLAPWYRTPWFIALVALACALTAYLVHRTRVRFLLQLERQRARIAMDLHDELGSGLGSIGILAGVLQSTDDAYTARARRMAGEIATTATELSSALSDIVWSLDPRPASIQDVASRLLEHAGRLFPDGHASFTSRMPAVWPAQRLDLKTRRNLLLIGLEALHNASRHAGATTVTFDIACTATKWTLTVKDDGRGLRPGDAGSGGRGIAGMKTRAEEIGASLRITTADGAGTTVALTLAAPHVRSSRLRVRSRLRRVASHDRAMTDRPTAQHSSVAHPRPGIPVERPRRND